MKKIIAKFPVSTIIIIWELKGGFDDKMEISGSALTTHEEHKKPAFFLLEHRKKPRGFPAALRILGGGV
jgi:hypothetical protein